jgi:hypothetical protein
MFLFERAAAAMPNEDNIRHEVFHGGCSALIAHHFC